MVNRDSFGQTATNEGNIAVSKPGYYQSASNGECGVECIDAIEAALGEKFPGFLIGNIFKYLWRYDKKGGYNDLEKAQWYMDCLVEWSA